MSKDFLAPGESVTIDFKNATGRWFDTKTGREVTDPEEIAKCEEEMRPIIEREERLLMEQQLRKNVCQYL